LIAGDIGGPDWYHAGDEAMFAANVARLRTLCPDIEITAISRHPQWTAQRYRIHAIPPIGFPATMEAQADRQRLWNDVVGRVEQVQTSGTVNGGDRAAAAIAAVARADAVIVSGGGNLRSAFAEHIYERMALVHAAIALGTPALVLGQTIGPDLEPEHADLLARHLKRAALVGVRESHSASVAASLGVDADRILRQLDDAWFLRPGNCPIPRTFVARKESPWIAVTLAAFSDLHACEEAIHAFAGQLSAIMRGTGAEVVFIPHWNALGDCPSDARIARRLTEFLDQPSRVTILPVHSAEAICWMTRQAAMVITSRYHATVFALSGTVPCLSIYSDEYTRVRQSGALSHASMEEHAIDMDSCLAGRLAPAALALWRQRASVQQQLLSYEPSWRRVETTKWSRVADLLGLSAGDGAISFPAHDDLVLPAHHDIPETTAVSEINNIPAQRSKVRKHGPLAEVSAVILSKNGAGRIERCLESIARYDFGEIVVCVDRTTTDQTTRIARRFTDQVHLVETLGYIEPSLMAMSSLCSKAFVLRIDDDETLGGDWHQRVDWVSKFNEITHFFVPRRWLVPPGDKFIADEPWFPDLQLRFYRNDPGLITWPDKLHEPMAVQGGGLILTDRWIDHSDLLVRSREYRKAKCSNYRTVRPAKHLSHFYLWEDLPVQILPVDTAGFCCAMERSVSKPARNARSCNTYDLGSEILFNHGGNSDAYRAGEWADPERWGTWTDGHRATLTFVVREAPSVPVELTVVANAYVRAKHPNLRVFVVCGRTILAEWLLDTADVQELKVPIPLMLMAEKGPLTVAFQIVNPVSPNEMGESEDRRQLGLGFRSVRLNSAPSA
jgi:polysaccharide pyruvyl transferase WcaK-like protein